MIPTLKKKSCYVVILTWLSLSGIAMAQSHGSVASETNAAQGMPADSSIAAALQQVSAERIRANIEKLVAFGTRSTKSAQDAAAIKAGSGVGAAGEWIKSEFERYSKDCGGCL